MKSHLANRAKPSEGVVYTATMHAKTMIREAIFKRLAEEYEQLSVADFSDFQNGRLGRERALELLKSIRSYRYLDPAVGQGIFLETLYQEIQIWQKQYSVLSSRWLSDRVTGYDIDKQMLDICRRTLSYKPLLVHGDFLKDESVKSADIIIANPPYIRQELLQPEYKQYLIKAARQDWPTLKITARSDIYIYFMLKSARILNDNGIMTFIVPNSWMDNDFGVSIRQLLTNSLQLSAIQERHWERHFDAEINTVIITIVKKKVAPEYQINIISDNQQPIINQTQLEKLVNGWYGSLFRCPEWLQNFLTSNRIIVPLQSQLSVKTGIITGNNRSFYSAQKTTSDALPVIRTPRAVKSIIFKQENATIWLNRNVGEVILRRAPLLWVDLRGSRHLVAWNRDNLPFEHTFYGLTPLDNRALSAWAMLLNSTWVWLMVELFGRKSLGGGAIRLVKSDLLKLPLPTIDRLNLSGYNNFLNRPIHSWREELKQPDRRQLDLAIFAAMGLENRYNDIIELTQRLMQQRELKSRS